MTSLSDDNQSDIIEAFNSRSRYLDDLLDIDNQTCKDRIRTRALITMDTE